MHKFFTREAAFSNHFNNTVHQHDMYGMPVAHIVEWSRRRMNRERKRIGLKSINWML